MDVEKTIQAILESQLRADQRADRADQRADRFDKQLQVTANLVREGIKLVRKDRESHGKLQREFRESQKETDFKFNALMDSHMRTEEQFRDHDQWLRKHDEAMRKSDEKFNRLLEELRRKNGNGRK